MSRATITGILDTLERRTRGSRIGSQRSPRASNVKITPAAKSCSPRYGRSSCAGRPELSELLSPRNVNNSSNCFARPGNRSRNHLSGRHQGMVAMIKRGIVIGLAVVAGLGVWVLLGGVKALQIKGMMAKYANMKMPPESVTAIEAPEKSGCLPSVRSARPRRCRGSS